MTTSFKRYLQGKHLTENTIRAYVFAVGQYESLFGKPTAAGLRKYKLYLIEHYRPNTVNLRLRALNCYAESTGKPQWRLPLVKVQQKSFLEHVISQADYEYFKQALQGQGEWLWYFVIRFLAATGARIGELLQIKAEHVQIGYIDLYGKGGKLRRIYIPRSLQWQALQWLEQQDRRAGFIFTNKYGKCLSSRGIANRLKHLAAKYGLNPQVVYPHSFRHRFAKSFLEKYNDIALLADLMGHESIETTRIYLRKTATEQRCIIDTVIDW